MMYNRGIYGQNGLYLYNEFFSSLILQFIVQEATNAFPIIIDDALVILCFIKVIHDVNLIGCLYIY